jgi:alpha-galactosidase
VKTVGLCHSVQGCAEHLCRQLDLPDDDIQSTIAGINHQGWVLEITRHGKDLYPEIKRRAEKPEYKKKNAVRFEIMKRFGYFVTESSEHSAEYVPWFIKKDRPDLIDTFHIPLDEYPRRCVNQIEGWEKMRAEMLEGDKPLEHKPTSEYASRIIHAMIAGEPTKIGGNVLNWNLIPNLPYGCCVEAPCLVDRSGVTPCHVGPLPMQCAALTRTNVNVHELTIEAALTGKKEHLYQAALLDPHTSSELAIDTIIDLCDDLLDAHGDMVPKMK